MGASISKKTTLSFLAIFALVTGGLLYRRPDTFFNPQLWAEDGTVFLQQYLDMGVKSIVTPYAGYLHFIPRLVAALAGMLSISLENTPAFYNAFFLIVTYMVSVEVFLTAKELKLKNPIFYAVIFIFVPVGTEMFMNITNVIWVVAVYLVNFLFAGYKRYEKENKKLLRLVLLLVASLTGPFSLLLSPLVALVLFLERKQFSVRKVIPLAPILIGGLVQLLAIKLSSDGISRSVGGEAEENHLLKLVVHNVSDLLFLRSGMLPQMSETLVLVICLIACALLVYLFVAGYRKIDTARKYILVLAPIVFLGSFVVAFWPRENVALAFGCPRYYFVPFTCIAWFIILLTDKHITRTNIFMYACYFLLQSKNMRSEMPDKEWKKQVEEFNSGKRESLDINPEGWQVTPNRKQTP